MAKSSDLCGCKKKHVACPVCVQAKIRMLQPGDTLRLKAGQYSKPLTLDGLRGTGHLPITICAKKPLDAAGFDQAVAQPEPDPDTMCVFTSGVDAGDYRRTANSIARLKQDSGEFPGLYYIADEALIHLRDCQHIRLHDLYFDRCWPTAVYLDNCQDIEIHQSQFRHGTFAIGASGQNTRHLFVNRCRWVQNPDNNGQHWKHVSWKQIHGHHDNTPPGQGAVNVDEDYRHFDGDFFCGWRISGFVCIRNCVIEDAFNAIHLFAGEGDRFESRINRNVVIEGCTFRRIRDNAVEPEEGAWNWVVRNNRFIDVYRWFSLQMKRSGWFYVYGNIAWHTGFPGNGPARVSGTVLKLGKQHKADGPHYVFHNSWHLRETIATKGRLADFHFFNNAIAYCLSPATGQCQIDRPAFAKRVEQLSIGAAGDDEETHLKNEAQRFTKAWRQLDISFHDNVIGIGPGTDILRAYGFAMGPGSKTAQPAFAGPLNTDQGFKPVEEDEVLRGRASGFRLQMHFGTGIEVLRGGTIGVWQDNGERFALPQEFAWAGKRP